MGKIGFTTQRGFGDYVYGTRWDSSNTSPVLTKGLIRNGSFVENAYTSYPIQEQMRRCLLLDSGSVNYYLDASDSTKKVNGTASDLTGGDGQVMVEIPMFHYLQCQDGVYRYFLMSEEPFSFQKSDGTWLNSYIHPAFFKGGSTGCVSHRYIGAYEASMYDTSEGAMTAVAAIHTNLYASGDKMCSVSGQYPKTDELITEYRTMATARGAGWHQYGAYDHAMVSALLITEYGTLNSQAAIGNGRVSLTNGDWVASETFDGTNYGYIGKCGLSNGDGNASGANNDATNMTLGESPAYMSYRGVENLWGNVWKFIDGANINNATATGSRLYLNNNYSTWASDTDTNYTLAGSLAQVDGYVTDIMDADGFWPSASSGGLATTYLCDYYYTYFDDNNDSGWQVALVGGSAYSGAYAGAFCVYSSNGSSVALVYFGGRLSF